MVLDDLDALIASEAQGVLREKLRSTYVRTQNLLLLLRPPDPRPQTQNLLLLLRPPDPRPQTQNLLAPSMLPPRRGEQEQ